MRPDRSMSTFTKQWLWFLEEVVGILLKISNSNLDIMLILTEKYVTKI